MVVLKFGGSVLRDEKDLTRATQEVRSWIGRGFKAIAVVSAFEGVTDTLVRKSQGFGERPHGQCRALLTATGEITSASLLGLALDSAGVRATIAPPWAIGIRAEGQPLDAFPTDVDAKAVARLLLDHDALVVPGFIGLDHNNQLVLLGRGGSDMSAIYLAERVGADVCRLVKDVDGLYEYDPSSEDVRKGVKPHPRRYLSLPWAEALKLDGGIVQHKAVKFALDHRYSFEVATYGADEASSVSVVGDVPVRFAEGVEAAA